MSGVGQDKPERESQVHVAQAKLEETVNRAEKVAISLFSRIESVTKAAPPKTQEPIAVEPTSDLVILAAWINDKAARIDSLAKSIVNTMGRVEL